MDILMNKDNTAIEVVDGDFQTGNPDIQHTYFILNSTFNSFKHKPFYALNFQKNQNGRISKKVIKKDILQILTNDGFSNINVQFYGNKKLDVTAKRR